MVLSLDLIHRIEYESLFEINLYATRPKKH